jgi:flagellin-like protein
MVAMRSRGVSSIVSVVLLVAVVVLAAAGLYFWLGGLATKQQTTSKPAVITASVLDAANGKVAVVIADGNFTGQYLNTSAGTVCDFGSVVTLDAGEQAVCTMPPKPGEVTIYGPEVGSSTVISSASDIQAVSTSGSASDSSTTTSVSDFSGGSFTGTGSGSVLLLNATWVVHSRIAHLGQGGNLVPLIAVDSNGVAHSFWFNYSSTGQNTFAYANSSNWVAQQIDTPNNDANFNTGGIALASDNTVHLAWSWRKTGTREIYYANSSSGFTVNRISANGSADDDGPDIAVSSAGVVHVVWVQASRYIYYANSSTGFTTVVVKDTGGSNALQPDVAVSSAGTVHIVWSSQEDGDYDIYYANTTNWVSTQLQNLAGTQQETDIVTDSNNVAHVVWQGAPSPSRLYYANSSTAYSIVTVATGANVDSPQVDIAPGNLVHFAWLAITPLAITFMNSSTWAFANVSKVTSGSTIDIGFDVGPTGAQHVAWMEELSLRDFPSANAAFMLYATNATTYNDTGSFVSPRFDLNGSNIVIDQFSWSETLPSNTSLKLFMNVSNGTGGYLVLASNGGRPQHTGRYVQFVANFTGAVRSFTSTPVLASVSISHIAQNFTLVYTVNSAGGIGFVYLNSSCGGSNPIVDGPHNASGASFFTKTKTGLNSSCDHYVVANDTSGAIIGIKRIAGSPLTVSNNAPSALTPVIDPSPSDSLARCYFSATDAETQNPIYFNVSWWRGGTYLGASESVKAGVNATNSTADTGECTDSASYVCQVRPFDGTSFGSTVNSSATTVGCGGPS